MQSNMKRILLLSSNGRSGSSLVAEMISSLTASVYFFEPFRYASQYHRHPLEKKDIYWEWAAHEMMENQTQTVRRMFQDLYNCEFSGFKHVILRDGDRFFIFRRPFEAYRQLLTYPEKIYMVNGMERMCFQSPNRMIKTIRIRLKTVVKTLDMRSMRLILLVRDPRAIINSMLQAPPGEVFRFNPDLATEVCMNLYEDIITYQSLPSNLSDSILLVRGEDHTVGTYRTRDNISNFQIRLKVRKVANSTSSSILNLHGARCNLDETESDSESGASEIGPHLVPILNEVTLGWQEKLFSAAERRFYAGKKESDFDRDVLRKKFYHLVQAAQDGRKKGSAGLPKLKIYTTLDGELIPFYDQEPEELDEHFLNPIFPHLTDNGKEKASGLAQLVTDGLRRRRYLLSGRPQRSAVADKTSIPTNNVIVDKPTRESQLKNHGFSDHSQLMVVRFDVTEGDASSGEINRDGSYFDLCVIKYCSNGVLEITPDFTRDKKPYRVEMDVQGERVLYEYWIEHASTAMSYDDQIDEHRMLGNFFATQIQPILKDVGDVFEIPPEKCFRLVLNGEIVSAEDFEYDGLFVHYFVELPEGWCAGEESQLFGLTHTSHTNVDPLTRLDVAHFSHLFEIDLYFDINRFDIYKESLPGWPQIFLEVISVDSWSRAFLGDKSKTARISLFDRLSSATLFNSVQAVLEAFHQARSRFHRVTEGYDVQALKAKLKE
eukprot:maker-scaffold875_size86197-snap-gene-0.18 protein:Tk03494 transcript:maker-scaffold875_size86197-snap-gene-0.18-mRNA-1 annotation:"hypothetical protein BRAFLDRAFT_279949"